MEGRDEWQQDMGMEEKRMHELGIVLSIADKVLEIAKENDLTEIKAITMQIGEISSVIPDYLQKCFPAAVERSPLFEGTELKIEILPARYLCHVCGESFSLKEFKEAEGCPYCKEKQLLEMLTGRECFIKNIEAY